jgi:abequosyltransferase
MPSPIPTITVCIPAYNRAELLPALMDSIFKSSSIDFDVLIAEDHSPERAKIAEIAQYYAERFPNRVHYHENQKNLGYDGNLRCLISLAKGKYCLFMGNDDLLGDRAIEHLIEILQRNPDCGAVIRSYASFEGDSRNIKQIFRYFPGEIILSPGVEAISVAYRRAVVIFWHNHSARDRPVIRNPRYGRHIAISIIFGWHDRGPTFDHFYARNSCPAP